LKIPNTKRAGEVAQGVGPELKPQYYKKKKKKAIFIIFICLHFITFQALISLSGPTYHFE
jgi:hypothetical protein